MHRLGRGISKLIMGGLGGAALLQSTCFLESDFDPELLLAETASTFATDAIFFLLNSFLFSF